MTGKEASVNRKVNKKFNSDGDQKNVKKKPMVQLSRRRAVLKAKTGKYIDLPAVKKLRAAAFSLEEIASMVGHVGRHAVHKWRCGKARPKLAQRETLLQSLGIPVAEWLTKEEMKKMNEYVSLADEERMVSKKVYKKYLRTLGENVLQQVPVDR
jgi:transcriptional regulator with XRE-family HTH domain